MRTKTLLAGLLLFLAALVAAGSPASATCVIYSAPDSFVCASGTVGTPTVTNEGERCIDAVCPEVEWSGDGICVEWYHDGNRVTNLC